MLSTTLVTASASTTASNRTSTACIQTGNRKYSSTLGDEHHNRVTATFKAAGTVGELQALSARIELAYFNLADKQPPLAALDAKLIEHHKARFELIRPPALSVAT